MGADVVNLYLSHPKVEELQKSEEKFDICVFEVFAADALLVSFHSLVDITEYKIRRFQGLADHFGCTLVTYTTFGATNWIDLMTAKQV